MNTSLRKAGIAASILAGALALSACTGSSSWENEVRTAAQTYNSNMPADEKQDGCSALEMFGIDSPEALADMVESIPSSNEDMWSDTGVDPTVIPEGKQHDAVLIVADEMFKTCEGVDTQTVEEMVQEELDKVEADLYEYEGTDY